MRTVLTISALCAAISLVSIPGISRAQVPEATPTGGDGANANDGVEEMEPPPVEVSHEEASAVQQEGPAPDLSLGDRIRRNREREMPGNQRIGWERRRQVPFVRNGGTLNRKETALVVYADAQMFPPAMMMSLQRGIYYWLTLGVDIGGTWGTFQALLRIKQEMARTRGTNFFFWGWHIRTGFKYVDVDMTSINEDLLFEDTSWILTFENTFAFRFGRHRRRVIYINTEVYGDFDLTGQGYQTDGYIAPAIVGFETILGRNWNFFIEAGVIISLNGWQTSQGIISEGGDVFPVGTLGFAYRWGGVRTALPHNWRDPQSLPMR